MKRTTGHLAEKNGKWYAVINLYDTEGRRKEKWASLDLEAKRGTKTEANHRMNELLAKYNTGELYLMESLSKADQERMRGQYASLRLSERVAGATQSQRVDPYLSGLLRDGAQQNDAVHRLSGAVREGCDGR